MSALKIISNVLNHSTLFQIFKSFSNVKNYSQLFGTPVSYLPRPASWIKEWGETYHQRTGRGSWGGCSPPCRKKISIIRAKLMYRSGKDTVKKYFIIQYLDLFVFIPQLA